MKASTILGGTAGTLTTIVGLAAAVLLPVGGLIAGAIAVHGAVAGTMGTLATVALTAAGGVGGLLVGRIAAPIAAFAAVGVGALVGGLVKLAGSAVEGVAGFFKSNDKKPAAGQKSERRLATVALQDNGKSRFSAKFGGFSLKALFGAAQERAPANQNKLVLTPKPALEKKPAAPGM